MSARPSIKLTVGKKKAPAAAASPGKPPIVTPEGPQRKLTLKIGPRKSAEDGATEKEKKKKRPPKEKTVTSKKRRTEPPSGNEGEAGATVEEKPGPKRLKLNPSKKLGVQSIRIKNKGLVPTRPLGVGYDSEASDIELDPSIEEQFVLRMIPGDDCEYLRQVINERRFDKSEISFKPLTREGRRAIFRVRDKQYAATLVDLPCIVEATKSWDKRGWYKSADICQMLLVLGLIKNEKEAMDYPLPKEVDVLDEKTFQYANGLTPPLKYVRKRRFRDRIHTRTIEQVEREVADLIAKDETAIGPPRFELVDSGQLSRAEGMVQSGDYDEYDDMQDAEGEIEEYTQVNAGQEGAQFEDDLAAEMEAALAAGTDDEAVPADSAPPSHQDITIPAKLESSPGDTSGDESDDSEGEADTVPEAELDEEQLERQQQLQQQREEIAELEALIKTETIKWEGISNIILKRKLGKRLQSLKQDLALKKVSIGEGEDVDI